ncbi:MAG TPA: sulfotransferase [Bacteroidales bacterium]|nr:sulfotransferase [Bacteroidales bacterium]
MTNSRITRSTDFDKRPFWFKTLNGVWEASYPLGTRIRLDKDDLIRRARKKTGLQSLGKDFVDEPLERLIRSINEEAHLHPAGRFITRERLTGLLGIRLRAEYFFSKHPEILEQELYPAWIIVGIQRTGTTKLQRLLSADPDHRLIPSWEVINPVPLDIRENAADRRIAVAKTATRAVRMMSPGFYAIHPLEIFEPEEDVMLQEISFMSTIPEAMMQVPSYAQWLEQADQLPAYSYAVKLLKYLQWVKPARRWVLKSPHHLEFPDLIEKTFGEVRYIWPHRNIYESVPSFLSMVTYNHTIFSSEVNREAITAHWVRKNGYMLQKAMDYRKKGNNDQKFTDLFYHDVMKDPIGELSKLYRYNGGLTPELMARFLQHEKDHPHRKYGTHQYSLADFGLTEADIDRYTADYQQYMLTLYERQKRTEVQ